jgi:16S rRNA (guanine966-N2)-methyltransferase
MAGLRVIGGVARGLRLRSVPGDSTRPITDRTKESLFNILGADIHDATLLDLFAGTGSVGIEALSRGARFVRFVDKNPSAIQTVRANLAHTGLAQSAQVIRMDAFQSVNNNPDQKFDYVYIAPPQYKGLWKNALLALDKCPDWLSEDAWVIVQVHPREYEAQQLQHLVEFDQRKYGSTLLIFFKKAS